GHHRVLHSFLHDALPIYQPERVLVWERPVEHDRRPVRRVRRQPLQPLRRERLEVAAVDAHRVNTSPLREVALERDVASVWGPGRSEEHTSELQSLAYLVC